MTESQNIAIFILKIYTVCLKLWYDKFNVIDENELNMGIGNEIYQRIGLARGDLFAQGELVQLTYRALDNEATKIKDDPREEIESSYPVGYRPDKSTISSTRTYKKHELINKYIYLIEHQLAINGIYQLVTIIEALMGDILRKVILKFPDKINSNNTIKYDFILSASSIEEIHLHVVDSFLNKLAYTSPKEFIEECKKFLSVNLWECSSFIKYMEIKATRDIYLHNQGIANDIYIRKAFSHSRVKSGEALPIYPMYFLESYEECIKITEWLEIALHNVWCSSEFEEYEARQNQNAQQESADDLKE